MGRVTIRKWVRLADELEEGQLEGQLSSRGIPCRVALVSPAGGR